MNTMFESQSLSRRSVLRGLAGGGLAGILAVSGISQADAAKKNKKSGKVDAKTKQEMIRLAEIAGAALSVSAASDKARRGASKKRGKKGGRLVLDEGKLNGLNAEQRSMLKELVADVNSGKLGFAVTNEQGRVVSQVGSEKALDNRETSGDESGDDRDARWGWWRDGIGVYLYIDEVWTARLRVNNVTGVSFIAGLLRQLWQNTGVANFTYGTVVGFVLNELTPRIRAANAARSWVFANYTGFAWISVGGAYVRTPFRT